MNFYGESRSFLTFFLFSSSFQYNIFPTNKTPKQPLRTETRRYKVSLDRKLNENFLKFPVKFDGESGEFLTVFHFSLYFTVIFF